MFHNLVKREHSGAGDNLVVPLENAPRRGQITVRRYASAADADRHDLEFWMQLPASERVLQVWRLSQEQWTLAGHPPHESGLCRSVARVVRRATGRAKDLGDIEGLE
jgi:hypothetical protein